MKNLHKQWFVCFGVALVGCAGTTDDVMEAPAPITQGGMNGSGGINGESPSDYAANIDALLSALGVPAQDPSDASLVNPALVATGLLSTEGGRSVFGYAARCALPGGTTLMSGETPYVGGGMLATTASWLSAGLSVAQKEDVLTCMIAHLNPFGAHVPIFLSGPSVTSGSASCDGSFTVEEAIWQAKLPGPGLAPIYYVWPRVNLLTICGLGTDASWITRLCGKGVDNCGVQVRYDQVLACIGSNGHYVCNDKPAIQTTLQEGNLCLLHEDLL